MTETEAFFWARNALAALDFIKRLPKKKVRLEHWNTTEAACGLSASHTCGSIACLGGWVAVMPYFERYGVGRNDSGAPTFMLEYDSKHVAKVLFGDEEMFYSRKDDDDVENELHKNGNRFRRSDRWVAKRRLKAVLERCLEFDAELYKLALGAHQEERIRELRKAVLA